MKETKVEHGFLLVDPIATDDSSENEIDNEAINQSIDVNNNINNNIDVITENKPYLENTGKYKEKKDENEISLLDTWNEVIQPYHPPKVNSEVNQSYHPPQEEIPISEYLKIQKNLNVNNNSNMYNPKKTETNQPYHPQNEMSFAEFMEINNNLNNIPSNIHFLKPNDNNKINQSIDVNDNINKNIDNVIDDI
jgi:hypothetical protein